MDKERSHENFNSLDETDLDVTTVLNTLMPFQKHLPGMNYCGPGTNLDQRLEEDGQTPRPGNEPVDRADEAALRHDMAYAEGSDLHARIKADERMIIDLLNIPSPTCRERLERGVVLFIMFVKVFFGRLLLKTSSIFWRVHS